MNNKTAHVVTGLTPGVSYTFSVTAENAVSYQDNNINVRSANVTATTLKGGKLFFLKLPTGLVS